MITYARTLAQEHHINKATVQRVEKMYGTQVLLSGRKITYYIPTEYIELILRIMLSLKPEN